MITATKIKALELKIEQLHDINHHIITVMRRFHSLNI